jgi:hypothetical protein
MTLIYTSTNKLVRVGDKVKDAVVTGWREPQHLGSSGRVYVTIQDQPREFFPNVYGMKFVEAQEVAP